MWKRGAGIVIKKLTDGVEPEGFDIVCTLEVYERQRLTKNYDLSMEANRADGVGLARGD